MSAAQTQTPRTGSVDPLQTPVSTAQILRRAMPPWRRCFRSWLMNLHGAMDPRPGAGPSRLGWDRLARGS